MSEIKRCESCRWWQAPIWDDPRREGQYSWPHSKPVCRRSPCLPQRAFHEWCGEFEAREEEG